MNPTPLQNAAARRAAAFLPASLGNAGLRKDPSSPVKGASGPSPSFGRVTDLRRWTRQAGLSLRWHDEQNAAIDACVRRRNAQARPKTGFAAGSPIRSWTGYPPKAA
ncbi:hypothetical protein SAMN05216276_1006240 [Streptosporangium subroseum]|uniref:Transposase n=1 Tax=Streptosporangium subroseum TaxID=106412 RepID=A0A239D3V3_9ACTN|nr:hypothetical protein SAMN05216276_1006240 [Streptosporangium subroseum]